MKGNNDVVLGIKRLHKMMGLVLLLPLLGWVSTGVLFFIKPGYQAAFAPLAIKTYALDADIRITSLPGWEELRLVRTLLGSHLLIKEQGQYRHLNAATLLPFTVTPAQSKRLLIEALADNPARYGHLLQWDGTQGKTSTGVELTLDWDRLALRQLGADTRLINALYRVHYLQWTPYAGVNRVLGMLGLALLLLLSLCGGCLYWRQRAAKWQ